MNAREHPALERSGEPLPGTLGAVLYARKDGKLVPEAEWVALVRAMAAGEQHALHALYERSHRMVFTLAVRITSSRESAEEVTLDVFHEAWRRASRYDPANGTVLGWIMNLARSRAIDRVRFENRQKRLAGDDAANLEPGEAPDPCELAVLEQRAGAVRAAMAALTPDEQRSIEAAFFSGLTHAEIASRSKEPLGTVKSRIRAALQKLRRTIGAGEDP